MISNHLWEMLVAFHQSKTLTEAAKLLFLSQSSLSMGIKQLEKELNVVLVKRGKNHIELNKVGLEGARLAENYLRQGNAIVKQIQELDRRERIVTIASNIPDLRTFMIQKLSAVLPNRRISFEQFSSEVLPLGLLEGRFDYALTEYPIEEPDIICFPYITDGLMLRLHHTDPLAEKDALTLDDLKNDYLLAWNDHGFWYEFMNRQFRERLNLVFIESQDEYFELLQAFHLRSFVLETAVPPHNDTFPEGYRYLPLAEIDTRTTFYLCSLQKNLEFVQTLLNHM